MASFSWSDIVARLHDLAGVFGSGGLAILVAGLFLAVLAAAILSLYLVLHFGEEGVKMLVPWFKEALAALARETKKEHAAIKVERRFHYFFAFLAIICLAASLLHSMIPWNSQETERILVNGFITSLVVCVVLAPVSIGLSVRLK